MKHRWLGGPERIDAVGQKFIPCKCRDCRLEIRWYRHTPVPIAGINCDASARTVQLILKNNLVNPFPVLDDDYQPQTFMGSIKPTYPLMKMNEL